MAYVHRAEGGLAAAPSHRILGLRKRLFAALERISISTSRGAIGQLLVFLHRSALVSELRFYLIEAMGLLLEFRTYAEKVQFRAE